jgi:hypothetical protein
MYDIEDTLPLFSSSVAASPQVRIHLRAPAAPSLRKHCPGVSKRVADPVEEIDTKLAILSQQLERKQQLNLSTFELKKIEALRSRLMKRKEMISCFQDLAEFKFSLFNSRLV